jgi:hypothetical protein
MPVVEHQLEELTYVAMPLTAHPRSNRPPRFPALNDGGAGVRRVLQERERTTRREGPEIEYLPPVLAVVMAP